jgi:hypothetical protein
MLDQVLVGGAASLVNLIIHAVLLGVVIRTVQNLRLHDPVVPELLRHTVVIVATGALLVAGHFAEVVVWAFPTPPIPARPSSISPSAATRRSAMAI